MDMFQTCDGHVMDMPWKSHGQHMEMFLTCFDMFSKGLEKVLGHVPGLVT